MSDNKINLLCVCILTRMSCTRIDFGNSLLDSVIVYFPRVNYPVSIASVANYQISWNLCIGLSSTLNLEQIQGNHCWLHITEKRTQRDVETSL